MKNEIHRLGDYIREVDVRNKDLKVTNLLGVNLNKQFFPSIANIIGTDLSKYKVIKKGQFGCKFMSVGRDGILPISLLKNDGFAIISSAYYAFEVIDENILSSDYLMMWLRRPEFDRQLWFYSGGDVRGGVNYGDFCEMPIIIPSIEQQREIVSEYETISKRIKLNEQIIQNLEATAQTLYHKMFVEGIDKENLPEGWRIGTLGEIAEINSGKTCSEKSDKRDNQHKYPVAGASGIIGFSSTYNFDEKLMTIGRVGTLGVVNRYHAKMYMADNVLIIRSNYYEYCYQLLNSLDYNEITKGGVQSLITQTDLKESSIIIPSKENLELFENESYSLYSFVEIKKQENEKLIELQSLLLAKMGR